MRDGQLEDRLRAVLRGEADALPLTVTTAELERRLALRRRERVGRRAGLVAAAVALVAVGSLVFSASGWFRVPNVGSGPTAVPTASPESSTALPCETIDIAMIEAPPILELGLSPGDSIARRGAVTRLQIGDRSAEPLNDWSRLEPFLVEQSVRIQALASSPNACITHLSVTYAQGEPGSVLPPSFASGQTIVVPVAEPQRIVEFAPPALPGEWFALVRAVFAADPPAEVWADTVFRMVVPEPAPNDDSVLGPFPHLATPPATVFVDRLSTTVEPGKPAGSGQVTIAGQVPPRALYIVHVACLGPSPIRWSIGQEGQHELLVADDQPCDGTLAELGVERGTPTSLLNVLVEADPSTVWRIRVATTDDQPAFIPPALRMIETGDTTGSTGAVEAFGRCVTVAEAAAPCGGEWFDLDGARLVRVPAQSRVTLGLEDGWQIDQARITAVSRSLLQENLFAPEYSVAFIEDGGPLVTVQVPLDPGFWVVRVALNGSREGEPAFGAHYDMLLEVAAQ